MIRLNSIAAAGTLTALLAAPAALQSQRPTNAGEWRSYGADVASTRYAALDRQ